MASSTPCFILRRFPARCCESATLSGWYSFLPQATRRSISERAAELGIPVATNGGANAWAVAEHAIALILALNKRIVLCDRSVRAGEWRKAVNGFNTFEVAGKTVGIIGAGNIGRKVACRLKAFETEILYYDAFPVPEIEEKLGAKKVSLDELVAQADIITLHAPLLKETRGLLGARQFAMMKPGTFVINTSRAELIDEDALVAALTEKTIAGAGIDVYYQEPVLAKPPAVVLGQRRSDSSYSRTRLRRMGQEVPFRVGEHPAGRERRNAFLYG